MVGQAFHSEGREVGQLDVPEALAGEGMVDASSPVGLARAFEGPGFVSARCLIPEVAPAKLGPSFELRPPLLIRRSGIEVSDEQGPGFRVFCHPSLQVGEGFAFLRAGRHVDGRDRNSLDAAAHPVVLKPVATKAGPSVGFQFVLAVNPNVASPAVQGGLGHMLMRLLQTGLVMLLAALQQFSQDDDVRPASHLQQIPASD